MFLEPQSVAVGNEIELPRARRALFLSGAAHSGTDLRRKFLLLRQHGVTKRSNNAEVRLQCANLRVR